jgi:hypothetical protein
MITCSIDVTKIDKNRIKSHSNGSKYYEFVLIDKKEGDKYGNTHIIVEGVTKEERAQNIRGLIIGNGKDWSKQDAKPENKSSAATQAPDGDEIPF